MKNVVLITIDCLRKDHLTEEYTPNILRLAKEGANFENAFSVGCWTSPSMIALLTSTYPFMYGGDLILGPPRKSIASVLKAKGYHTAGFTYHPYLSRMYGFDKGFEEYHDELDNPDYVYPYGKYAVVRDRIRKWFPRSWLDKWWTTWLYMKAFKHQMNSGFNFHMPAPWINKNVMEGLNSGRIGEPFLVWVHYLDTHFPYLPKGLDPTEARDINLAREHYFRKGRPIDKAKVGKLLDLYRAKVRETDVAVADLVEKISEKHPDTVFVITADHGEEFNEHGSFHHEIHLYDELVHVPLVILDPSMKEADADAMASGLDVAPTILDIAGVGAPKDWMGTSVRKDGRDLVVCEEGQSYHDEARKRGEGLQFFLDSFKIAVRDRESKFIVKVDKDNELYDLAKDPGERDDLYGREEVPEHLKRAANEHVFLMARHEDYDAEREAIRRIGRKGLEKGGEA